MKYEEDPLANALICISEYESGCLDCGDFHLRSILRRMHVAANKKTGDLAAFNEATRVALKQLADTLSFVKIGIVGSTDTGLLANLLMIAHEIGGKDLVDRLDITLIDRCATPLIICQAYAERCGVPLKTQLVKCSTSKFCPPKMCVNNLYINGQSCAILCASPMLRDSYFLS